MIGLSYGIKMWAKVSFVPSQFTRLTDRRTDGQTDFSWLYRGCICSAVKKRKKIRIKKLRDVTSHVRAQPTHVALPPPKLSCGYDSGRSQWCQVSSELVEGFGLPGWWKSAIFLCWALWLIGYRLTCFRHMTDWSRDLLTELCPHTTVCDWQNAVNGNNEGEYASQSAHCCQRISLIYSWVIVDN